MVRETDRPAMTIAVDLGRKATKQTKQTADKHMAPQGRATQQSRDTRKTN